MRKAHVRSFQAKGRPITNEEVRIVNNAFEYSANMIVCSMQFISMLRITKIYQLRGQGSMPMEI
jgi:hypothetical protein